MIRARICTQLRDFETGLPAKPEIGEIILIPCEIGVSSHELKVTQVIMCANAFEPTYMVKGIEDERNIQPLRII